MFRASIHLLPSKASPLAPPSLHVPSSLLRPNTTNSSSVSKLALSPRQQHVPASFRFRSNPTNALSASKNRMMSTKRQFSRNSGDERERLDSALVTTGMWLGFIAGFTVTSAYWASLVKNTRSDLAALKKDLKLCIQQQTEAAAEEDKEPAQLSYSPAK